MILRMRGPVFGVASHDLSNAKATNLRAAPGALLKIDGNAHEVGFSLPPDFSERTLQSIPLSLISSSGFKRDKMSRSSMRPSRIPDPFSDGPCCNCLDFSACPAVLPLD